MRETHIKSRRVPRREVTSSLRRRVASRYYITRTENVKGENAVRCDRGGRCGLALGSDGKAHVTYFDPGAASVYYAYME
jgi:hypothetical protein